MNLAAKSFATATTSEMAAVQGQKKRTNSNKRRKTLLKTKQLQDQSNENHQQGLCSSIQLHMG